MSSIMAPTKMRQRKRSKIQEWSCWFEEKIWYRHTGGAIRHCEAATLNPMFFSRMIGKKWEVEDVTVMTKLEHVANGR